MEGTSPCSSNGDVRSGVNRQSTRAIVSLSLSAWNRRKESCQAAMSAWSSSVAVPQYTPGSISIVNGCIGRNGSPMNLSCVSRTTPSMGTSQVPTPWLAGGSLIHVTWRASRLSRISRPSSRGVVPGRVPAARWCRFVAGAWRASQVSSARAAISSRGQRFLRRGSTTLSSGKTNDAPRQDGSVTIESADGDVVRRGYRHVQELTRRWKGRRSPVMASCRLILGVRPKAEEGKSTS
jgi:hypothetical protein